jgi:UDP-perosamine 4-acetyltransferase
MEKRKKLVIIGGGGHSRVLIDLIQECGDYEIVGILDLQLKAGASVLGVPILGGDDLLSQVYAEGVKNACIGVGSTKDTSKRRILYEKVKRMGFFVLTLIHPRTIISKSSQIAEGVQIMAGAVVQAGVKISENTIINTSAIIEHDCDIGKNVHICPGAVVAGGVKVSDSALIGANATIKQGIRIGESAVVGAGAVVVKDVPASVIVKGVPAR